MSLNKQPVAAMKPADWTKNLPRPAYKNLKKCPYGDDDWFCVYDLGKGTYAIYEEGQYEESITYLLLGETKAMLC